MSAGFDGRGGFDGSDGEGGASLPGFLKDPKGVLKRRGKWMALIALLGLLASGFFLQQRTPTYSARATVLVASQKISEAFVTGAAEGDQLEKVSAILGELLSRKNLGALIQQHNLYAPKDSEEQLTLEEKVALMRAEIVIGPDRSNTANTGQDSSATVFEIIFTGENPGVAAEVTNALASGFTDIHLRMRSRQARLTTEFLRRELKQTEGELARQERLITEFKQTYRGQLPSELATNLGRLDRLQSQRQSLALQIAETESRLASLAASGSDFAPDSPESLLRALQVKQKEQRALYTDDHPNVVALDKRIESLEAQVRSGQSGGSNAAGATRLTLVELRRQLAQTVAAFEDLDRRVAFVPERQEELASLEQRVEILRESHREFLRKVNQAELAEAVESAQQGERAMVLDAAVPPSQPDSSPLKILVVMLVGTLGLAVLLALLLELVDSVIVGPSEIESQYRLPVIGSIAPIR
ncbi:MAG: GumC family protein [Myxococcota bacterium]